MPEDSRTIADGCEYMLNRELSWLKFNGRVLAEAEDKTVPVLERFHFLSIFTSNLDEFFMVRVGSLYDKMIFSPQEKDDKSGWSVEEQLEHIYEETIVLSRKKDRIYQTVMELLQEYQIEDKKAVGLTKEEQKYAIRYYKTRILPFLSPQTEEDGFSLCGLENKKLYVAVRLRDKKGKMLLGWIPVPDSVPRLLVFPGTGFCYLRVETLVSIWAVLLFPEYETVERCILSVTRNENISYADLECEKNDFRDCVSKLVKERTQLPVVRLEVEGNISPEFMEMLEKRIGVSRSQVFLSRSPLDLSFAYSVRDLISPKYRRLLVFPSYEPQWPEDLKKEESMIAQIQRRDRMLYFPYDSIEPFLMLMSEAAEDERVASIKITVYRLASASKIARALCRAAENGKQVTVLVELRARFDEENNISWSKILEEAGCHVIYGPERLKCHSKILCITYWENGERDYITQIGTGNYNEKTSRAYTDLSYMTASKAVGEDAIRFFENMEAGRTDGEYRQLCVSPVGLRNRLIACIEEEIEKKTAGYICMKANSLTDRRIINKLKEASCAGVQVQLILRGICCLRPGIANVTENIQVTSIVGRYLEHARIYCFGRGVTAKIYLSSADLMTRNLQKRVEIACPVTDLSIRRQLLWILKIQLMDNVKACLRLSDGSYSGKCCEKENAGKQVDSQELFMRQSIHMEEISQEKNFFLLQQQLHYRKKNFRS